MLCMGRSGSTLLRFLLDTHPDLACPPETNIPALCSQLAVVWSLIEGAPLSAERGDAPPQVPDAAVKGIRRMLDEMTGSYLVRRGKRLFCDKSLGSARSAGLLQRIYPRARFVCVYRHPMDMISSGLEACPWGLNGYGFDRYIADSPGNAVLALARYWLDNAIAIAAVEEAHPGQCHRVRYEDLVRGSRRSVMQEACTRSSASAWRRGRPRRASAVSGSVSVTTLARSGRRRRSAATRSAGASRSRPG